MKLKLNYVWIIKYEALLKHLGKERCNVEEMDENLLQNIVFCSVFRLEGVFSDTKVAWRVHVCFRDKL